MIPGLVDCWANFGIDTRGPRNGFEPQRLASNFVHGIKRMPCTFTPGGAS